MKYCSMIGLVESELGVELGPVRRGCAGAQDDDGGVPGQQVDEVEGPDRDDEDDADQHDQPSSADIAPTFPQ